MEDFKILLYVFGIVIYIIYMAMRKYFNPEEQAPDREEPPVPKYRPRPEAGPPPQAEGPSRPEARPRPAAPTAPPPTSFEEMMRRLEKPKPKAQAEAKAEKAVEKAQEKAEEIRSKAEKARDLVKQRVTDYARAESRPVINYETSSDWRKSIDSTPARKKVAINERRKPVHPYAAMLQNPKDARAAFVLTQILERKEW